MLEEIGSETQQAAYGPYDRWWEDFETDLEFTTRGITVTETHIVNWSMLGGDWLPIHVDQEESAGGPFGSVIAHGPLTLALALGLVTQSNFFGDSVVAWLGLDELRLPAPVRPGDTVRVHVTVLEVAETSKPERGRLRIGYRVMNQERETVMTFTSGFLVRRKSP
jgi:itaconyl-CoA hydratase